MEMRLSSVFLFLAVVCPLCSCRFCNMILFFFCRTLFSGYDGDDEADLAFHVSESSSVADADSNIPNGEVDLHCVHGS